MSLGRHEPCHCGSGRKYKNCHYAADRDASATPSAPASDLHELDRSLVDRINVYVTARFEQDVRELVEALATYPDFPEHEMLTFIAYVGAIRGRNAVDWFLDDHRDSLSRRSLKWLEMQQKTPLSIWEIIDLVPGRSVTMSDVLTGVTRTVHEVRGSQVLEPHLFLLCRVIDAEPDPVICGMYPRPLRPTQAEPVITSTWKALRRKTHVSPERLLDQRIVWHLMQAWASALDAHSRPPQLVNNDGDPFLLTTDRWRFDLARREEMVARLEAIEGLAPRDEEFSIVREDNIVTANLRIEAQSLIVETNSVRRADAARKQVIDACGDLISSVMRSHEDPLSPPNRARAADLPMPEVTAEMAAITRQVKEQHYEAWVDQLIPAFEGRTPREMARTAAGRERLRLMLNDIEYTERHSTEPERFDVDKLRAALGISE